MQKRFIISALFSILVYVFIILFLGISNIVQTLKDFSGAYLIIAILFIILSLFFEFIRWEYYLKVVGLSVNFKTSIKIFFSGLALGFMPAKSGELLRYYMLKKKGLSLSRSLPIHFISNLTAFFVALLFSLPILFILKKQMMFYAAIGLLFIFYFSFRYPSFYLRILKVIESRLNYSIFKHIRVSLATSRGLLNLKSLSISLLLTFIYYSCMGGALFYILRGFEMGSSFFLVFSIYSASLIIGGLSMLPGGVGAVEYGGIALLSQFMDISIATVIVIMMRFISLWLTTFIGIAFLNYSLPELSVDRGTPCRR